METLIAARVALPPLPNDCIRTPSAIGILADSLNAGGTGVRRLSLVCAPTGYGKSTALAAAVETSGTRPAYVRVSEHESDPTRFWSYVAAALGERYGIGEQSSQLLSHAALTGLMSGQSEGAHESFIVSLLNECADFGEPVILAIDDFQEIESDAVAGQLATLLGEMPPNMHLVILTREEPRFDLHRMRARGELLRIGTSELAFTVEECREFVRMHPDGRLSQSEADRLFALTEGWPAGLRLAVLAPGSGWPATTSGDTAPAQEALCDFLGREILARQPGEVHDFLLATSILSLLSDYVCEKVAGKRAGSPGLSLEELCSRGLLIVREGPYTKWYRYSVPFSEMLRRRLVEQRTPRQIAALHRRAARAYADEGLYAEALHHAFEAADTHYAADLLEDRMADLLNGDRNAHLTAYIGRLPDELLEVRPHLAAAAAMMLVVSGRGAEATRAVDQIDRQLEVSDASSSGRSLAAGVGDAVRGLAAVYAGDLGRSEEYGRRALEHLPFDAVGWRTVATIVAADAQFLSGRIDLARDGYSRALAMCRTHRLHFLLMIVALRLIRASLYEGRLDQTERLIDEFLDESRRIGFANSAHEGQIVGFNATLAVLQGRPRVALERAMRCAESAEGHRSMIVFGMTRIRLAEAYFALRQLERMREVLDEASERLSGYPLPIVESFLFAWRVRLEVAASGQARRRPERALELLRERGIGAESPIRVLGERELFAAARAYRLAGSTDEARRLLERLRDFCDESGMVVAAMEARILLSLMLNEAGDRASALISLAAAVEQLVPRGAIGLFLSEGEPMKRLLATLLGTPAAPKATGVILSRFDAVGSDTSAPDQPGERPVEPRPAPGRTAEPSPIEPLSRRELDVLRLIVEGKSNSQIADALFISLHTVKWHTGHIYSKLDVEGRTAAVARARALGLLE